MARRYDFRRAKIHRTYSQAEIAKLFDVNRQTVRRWISRGLPPLDSRRPCLVHGRDLQDFLQNLNPAPVRRLGAGEIFCLACREPRSPAGGLTDYEPHGDQRGRLVAICPVCGGMMSRLVRRPPVDPGPS